MLDLAVVPGSPDGPTIPSSSVNRRKTFQRSGSSNQRSTCAPPQLPSNNVIDTNALVRTVEDMSHRIVAQLAKRRFVEAAQSSAKFVKIASIAASQAPSARTTVSNLAVTTAGAWFEASHPMQGLRLLPLIDNPEVRANLTSQSQEWRDADVSWLTEQIRTIENLQQRDFAQRVWEAANSAVPNCSIPVPTFSEEGLEITWSLASGAFSIVFDTDGYFVWAAADHVGGSSCSGENDELGTILTAADYNNWMNKILDVG